MSGSASQPDLAPAAAPVVAVLESARFEEWIAALGLPRVVQPPHADAFVLLEHAGALELRPPGELDRPGITAVFPPDAASGSGRAPRLPLSKAFGSRIEQVLDATAGLGADAYRLAAAGHRVRACERHPAVYALLASAWAQACDAGQVPAAVAERLSFEWGEAATWIDSLDDLDQGVYLDPMYPAPRRRSALPRRAVQVLRALIGPPEDTLPLLVAARARAARVVVKRPHHAPALMEDVGFSVESKLMRLDVYLNPARMKGAR